MPRKHTTITDRGARDRRRRKSLECEKLEARLLLAVASSGGREGDGQGHAASSACESSLCSFAYQQTAAQVDSARPTASFPLQETFKLHSLPSASKRIYLDFDGHTTSGTAWNNGGTIVTPAYSLDSNSSFSDSELTNIQEMWSRVSEDFSPFNVDVTTEEPAIDDLRKVGAGDTRWGIRVVIGRNTGGLGGGGIAYLGSFNWDSDTPCFVFPELLGYRTSIIALATSHEVGHSLGLSHDGGSSGEYYGGQGTGPTGWGPIMGNPDKALTQWSKGEYKGATNTEDDLAIIVGDVKTRYTPDGNGFGYRTDDYGNAINAAAPVVETTMRGIIERNNDVDVFSFSTTGRIGVTVAPIDVGANLDVLAEIVDASSVVVATSNPTGAIGASFALTVAPGVYYLRVKGTGEGDPLGVGYTNYGSLGQYTVTFSGVNPPPEIVGVAIAGATVKEGTGGETIATLKVTLSKASDQVVTVDYQTKDGTAKAGANDYVSIPSRSTITFQPGETVKTITVKVVGDDQYEADETFSVVLSNAVGGYILGGGVGVCTIKNDDLPVARIQVFPAIVSEAPAGFASIATFTLKIGGVVLAPFTIAYATRDGSARANSDYRPNSGVIQVVPGQTEKRISVSVYGDGQLERDEQFGLVLNAVGTFDPLAGTNSVVFTDPVAGVSSPGTIATQATILDYDSRFFTVRALTPSVASGGRGGFSIAVGRLPGYGPAVPSLDAVPELYRAELAGQVRFTASFSVREGVRGPEMATQIFGANTATLGWVPDAGRGVVAASSQTVLGTVPFVERRQVLTVRLSGGVNARTDSAAATVTIQPTIAAAFAGLSASPTGTKLRR